MNFHRNYAIVVFYNENNEILFQDRTNLTKQGEEWGFFGGGLETGESFEEGLVREVQEELGLDIRGKYTYVGSTIFALEGSGQQETRIYDVKWNTEYEEKFQVLEGAGAKFMTLETMAKKNIAPWSYIAIDMLKSYF